MNSSDTHTRRPRRNDSRRRHSNSRSRNNSYRPGDSRGPRSSERRPEKRGLWASIQSFFKKLMGGKSSTAPARDRAPRNGAAPSANGATSSAPVQEVRPEVLTPKLYVGNLAYETSESDLFDFFQQIGVVKNVEVVRDRNSNSKGFGFVEMETLESAQTASAKLHRTDFMGRQIVVSGAKAS